MTIAAERTAVPHLPHDDRSPRERLSRHFGEIFETLKRLTGLQVSIWLKQVKSLVTRIVMVAILSVIALFFVLMAVIFLYAGVYHVLTDILHIPTAWALLIFAGVHLLAAGILVIVAISMLRKRDKDGDDKTEKLT